MPEPILIELDGKTTFLVGYGAESGVLELDPTTGVPGHVLLSDCTGHCGSMKIEPDPVRVAVLKERERCKARFRAAMEEHHYVPATIDHVVDAIDAPAEEKPSGYDRGYARGAAHVRDLAAQIAYDKRLVATESDGASMACRNIEYAIRNISTEPTP